MKCEASRARREAIVKRQNGRLFVVNRNDNRQHFDIFSVTDQPKSPESLQSVSSITVRER